MYFSSLFAASAIVVLSIAAPPSQEALGLRPESCSVKLPASYQQINQAQPKQSYPRNFIFKASQNIGGVDNIATLLRFTGIPSGSFGCALSLSFTFEFPITNTGASQVNAYALPKDIRPSDTWATYFPDGKKGTPLGSFLFGTTTIDGNKTTINSEVCKDSLNYLFLISSDTKAGEVTFADAGNNLSGIGGFYISYNC